MQNRTSEEVRPESAADSKEPGADEVARLCKYFLQFNNPRVKFPQKLAGMQSKSYYRNHRKTIDKLCRLFGKYGIDAEKFLKFVSSETKIYTPELLLNTQIFRDYALKVSADEEYEKIYRRFMKSVRNIAGICIERNITAREFLRDTIVNNKLAYEYISGRISKYYIASMQNFREIYGHLDQMNKTELRIIYNAADELHGSIQDAFLKKTGERVKPLKFVEQEIEKIKKENTKTQSGETNVHIQL